MTWQAAAGGSPGDTNAINYAAELNQFLQGQDLIAVGPGDQCVIFGCFAAPVNRSAQGSIAVTQTSPSGATYNIPADIAGALTPTTPDPLAMTVPPTFPNLLQPIQVLFGGSIAASALPAPNTLDRWFFTSSSAFYRVSYQSLGGGSYGVDITPCSTALISGFTQVVVGTAIPSPPLAGTVLDVWMTNSYRTLLALVQSSGTTHLLSASFDGAVIGAWATLDTYTTADSSSTHSIVTGSEGVVVVLFSNSGSTTDIYFYTVTTGTLGPRGTVSIPLASTGLTAASVIGEEFLLVYAGGVPTIAWCDITSGVPTGVWTTATTSTFGAADNMGMQVGNTAVVVISQSIGTLTPVTIEAAGAGIETAFDPRGNLNQMRFAPGRGLVSGNTFYGLETPSDLHWNVVWVGLGAPMVAPLQTPSGSNLHFDFTAPSGYVTPDSSGSSGTIVQTTMPEGCWLLYNSTRYVMIYGDTTGRPFIICDYTLDHNGNWVGATTEMVYDGVNLVEINKL